eukprot:XP_025007820.1 uncharacterized protein LOC112532726 [Gallus gallus]
MLTYLNSEECPMRRLSRPRAEKLEDVQVMSDPPDESTSLGVAVEENWHVWSTNRRSRACSFLSASPCLWLPTGNRHVCVKLTGEVVLKILMDKFIAKMVDSLNTTAQRHYWNWPEKDPSDPDTCTWRGAAEDSLN